MSANHSSDTPSLLAKSWGSKASIRQFRSIPGAIASRTRLFSRLAPSSRLAAINHALNVASGPEIEAFAAELLELFAKSRAAPVAQAVVTHFWRFSAQARSAALCVDRERLVAAACALDPGYPETRRSLAVVAGMSGAPALYSRLVAMLSDPDAKVADEADRAISEVVAGAGTLPAHARAAAEQALFDAIATFDRHRRRGVLLAGLRLLGTPASFAAASAANPEWLNDATHPAQLAIRALLRRTDEPDIARAALVWLKAPAQATACTDRLIAAASVDEFDIILRLAPLVAHPLRARALKAGLGPRSRRGGSAWSLDPTTYSQLCPEARRHVPRWLGALPTECAQGDEAAGLFVCDPSPLVRMASLVEGAVSAEPDLADMAYDENALVARSATLRILHLRSRGRAGPRFAPLAVTGGHAGDRTFARLARSPHACVRALCHAARADTFGPGARTGWRLSRRRNPAETLADLRDRVLMGDVPERVSWIAMARSLGLSTEIERDLCGIVEDSLEEHGSPDSPRSVLAATAVRALGDCRGDRSRALLNSAVSSNISRVQSNAIEALASRALRAGTATARGELADCCLELKRSPLHRVRATSVLAFARLLPDREHRRAAAACAASLLDDARAPHRLAGVWLAERLGSTDVVGPAELIEPVRRRRSDDDADVRARAERCAKRLGLLADAVISDRGMCDGPTTDGLERSPP